jgi:phosphate transport system substrate-binding protein
VTQQVKQTAGAIGYVELVYARSNGLPVALVQNAAGQFVQPTLESVTAAAAGAKLDRTTDFRVSITNAEGPRSYPIASYTWLLVKTDTPDAGKARALRDFLTWMITPEAQKMADDLGYAPLPDEIVGLVRERIKTLKSGGRPIA